MMVTGKIQALDIHENKEAHQKYIDEEIENKIRMKNKILVLIFELLYFIALSQHDTSTLVVVDSRNYIHVGTGITPVDMVGSKTFDFGRYYQVYFVPSSFWHINLGWSREINDKVYYISSDFYYPLGTDSLEKQIRGKVFKINTLLGLKRHLSNKWVYYCFMGWRVYIPDLPDAKFFLAGFYPYISLLPPLYIKNLISYNGIKNNYALSFSIEGISVYSFTIHYFFNYRSKTGVGEYSNKRLFTYYLGMGMGYHNFSTSVIYRTYLNNNYYENTYKGKVKINVLSTIFQFDFQYKRLLLRSYIQYPLYYVANMNVLVNGWGYKYPAFASGNIGYTSRTDDRKVFFSMLYGLNYPLGIKIMDDINVSSKYTIFRRNNIFNEKKNYETGIYGLGRITLGVGYRFIKNINIEFYSSHNLFMKYEYIPAMHTAWKIKIDNFNLGLTLNAKI